MSLLISHIATRPRISSAINHVQSSFILQKPYITVPLLLPSSSNTRKRNEFRKCFHMKAHTSSFTDSPCYDTKDYVLDKASSVNRALEEAVLLREPLKLQESMRYSLISAERKRVYSVLCIAACELMGGQESTAMPSACAVEMIHTSFSILADLPSMNNNSSRWGKPTNHEVYGEDVAILAADALLALAFEHVATATKGLDSERIMSALAELAKCMGSEGLTYEHLMMTSVEKPDEFFDVHLQKPAALLEGSMVLGAIIGGADDQHVSELRDFARSIAPLFQAVDDI